MPKITQIRSEINMLFFSHFESVINDENKNVALKNTMVNIFPNVPLLSAFLNIKASKLIPENA